MKKIIVLSLVLFVLNSVQAQVVTLPHINLHVFPYDLGPFPERPSVDFINRINENESYDFDTWRLPTREEMAMIRQNRQLLQGVRDADYITSNYLTSGYVRLVSTGRRVSERRAEAEHERWLAEQRRLEEERRVAEQRRIAEERAAAERRRLETMGAVVINGIGWARFNLGSEGVFVSSAEQQGGRFSWHNARNACPAGWRLPTMAELQTLGNGSWNTQNGVQGRVFGVAPNQIFLPATGRNTNHGGGNTSYYWSSTAGRWVCGVAMRVDGHGVSMTNNIPESSHFNVRCVVGN